MECVRLEQEDLTSLTDKELEIKQFIKKFFKAARDSGEEDGVNELYDYLVKEWIDNPKYDYWKGF